MLEGPADSAEVGMGADTVIELGVTAALKEAVAMSSDSPMTGPRPPPFAPCCRPLLNDPLPIFLLWMVSVSTPAALDIFSSRTVFAFTLLSVASPRSDTVPIYLRLGMRSSVFASFPRPLMIC